MLGVVRRLVHAIESDERLSRRLIDGTTGALGVCRLAGLGLVEQALEARDRAALVEDDTFCTVGGGRRVRYRLLGSERRETGLRPVVLVHGLSGSLEEWGTVQERLAEELPVLAYDRGGMGFSDAMTPNDAEAQAEELAEVLRATGLEPPYVVVTYSASALLASRFALRHPEQVRALLFLDSILPDWGYLAPRFFVAHLVQSFFGVLRLKAASEFGGPPTTLDEQKRQAVYARYAHWIASTDDGVRLGNWESQLLALPPFAGFPVGVLTTFDEGLDYEKGCVDKSRLLAARARGTFSSVREEHGSMGHKDLLTTARGADVVAAFVRRISQG